MINLIKKIFGDKKERDVKLLWPIVEEINKHYEELKKLSDDELPTPPLRKTPTATLWLVLLSNKRRDGKIQGKLCDKTPATDCCPYRSNCLSNRYQRSKDYWRHIIPPSKSKCNQTDSRMRLRASQGMRLGFQRKLRATSCLWRHRASSQHRRD